MPWPLNGGDSGGDLVLTTLLAFHVQIVLFSC